MSNTQSGDRRSGSSGQPNEGEGNKSADRNYRKATREFVESERGQKEARKAGDVSPAQEREIRRAEEEAKKRAKEHDPQERSDQK